MAVKFDNIRSKILTSIKASRPFFISILIIGLIVFVLQARISAKKNRLETQRVQASKQQKPLTNVVALELIPSVITETLTFPGVAKPWISIEAASEITGKIIDKKATQGLYVKKGDILAIVDKRDYQNKYDSALAAYEIALANQKRLKALIKKKVVSQSQLDDVVALVKTSKANYEIAKLDLQRCEIRAPIKGIIDRIHIENGSFVNSGTHIVNIIQIDKLKIMVGIPESDVDSIRNSKTFDITIDALDNKAYVGKLYYLYKTADPMARLYNLDIEVVNLKHKILPDMFARVKIIKNQDTSGIAVPVYSLVSQNKKKGVFVVIKGIAKFKPVKTGFQDGWTIQIVQGLESSEKVIVAGHRIIEDNEKVNVTKVIDNISEIL